MANELQPLSLIFQNRLFRIPDYQRGYAWQQHQLVDFWDDLNNLQSDRYHYTGLLSLKLLNNKETSNWGNDLWMVEKGYKPCHIVDGQQRLTTFIILLNELVRFARGLDDNRGKSDENIVLGYDTLKEVVAKYICQKRPPQNMITTYLFGYEIDNPSDKYLRHRVFNEPFSGEVYETYYTKNLKNAKEFFANNISVLFEEEGINGINSIYQKLTQKMMFNLHEINDDYDVFVAFETMNNRGKRLTNLELLKNRLIYLTTIYNDSKLDVRDKDELRKQINEAWKEVYFQLGRNKMVALSDDEFLRAHWIIYYSYSRQKGDDYIRFLLNKFSAKNIFEKKPVVKTEDQPTIYEEVSYDEEEESFEPGDTDAPEDVLLKLEPKEISDYVNSLKDLAKYWYDTFFPYESDSLTDNEKIWIDRLNRIGIGYFRPLVMVTLSKGINESERVDMFAAIERFIFVSFRLAGARSNYQSTVYYSAARDIYHRKETVKKITESLNSTTDANIQYAIPAFIATLEKKYNSEKCEGYYAWSSLRYFMYEYEYSLMENTGIKKITWEMFSRSEKDKVSIEHILPQTPTKWYWRNQFRQFINNPKEMAALTGSLGNLLPLSQSINSSLQNDSFNEKKNPSGKGRRGYTRGSNSEIEVAEETVWNAQKIHERALRLIEFMVKRWNINLSDEQKRQLLFDDFIFDERVIPNELPMVEDPKSGLTAQEIRHEARLKYWTYALPIIKETHGGDGHPYGDVNPTEDNSKAGYFNVRGIHLYCSVSMKKPLHCSTGLWIDTRNKESNKALFDLLYSHKDEIEAEISMPISWNRKDEHVASSIEFVLKEADFTDQSQWPEISAFHAKMSKELADKIFYPYEQEIRKFNFIADADPNNNLYYSGIFRAWATRMTERGLISVDLDKCKKTYTRFKTPIMSKLLPDAEDSLSGWKTKNFYFYEIRNTEGIFIQLAVSGENIPDNLRDMCDRINEYYPARRRKKNWQWRINFTTKKFKFDTEPSEKAICSHLDHMLEEIKKFEADLCEKLGVTFDGNVKKCAVG